MVRKKIDRALTAGLLVVLGCGLGFGLSSTIPVQAQKKEVAAAQDVDFGPYMARLQSTIKRHWFPPRGTESKHIKVTFKMDSAGKPSNVKVNSSSGDEKADAAAIAAVQDAGSFGELPAGSPQSVDIEFTFDYNVFDRKNAAAAPDLQEKLRQAEASGDQAQIIRELVALADDELNKKKSSEAIEHYKRAIDLIHKKNPFSDDYLADQLTALGDIYYDCDDYDSCSPLYEECLKIRLKDKGSSQQQLAQAKRDVAYALLYIDDGDIDRAKTLFVEAIAHGQVENDPSFLVDVKQGIAHCHWKNGEYAKALPLYQQVLAQKKAADPNDFGDLGYRSKDVADCMYELHNYRDSLGYFRDAKDLLEKAGKTGDDDELADAREKVTEISARLGLPENKALAQAEVQKQKSTDNAYAWLPYAFGGSILALIIMAFSNSKNSAVDIAGRNRKG